MTILFYIFYVVIAILIFIALKLIYDSYKIDVKRKNNKD